MNGKQYLITTPCECSTPRATLSFGAREVPNITSSAKLAKPDVAPRNSRPSQKTPCESMQAPCVKPHITLHKSSKAQTPEALENLHKTHRRNFLDFWIPKFKGLAALQLQLRSLHRPYKHRRCNPPKEHGLGFLGFGGSLHGFF